MEQFKADPAVQAKLRDQYFTVFPAGKQVLKDIIKFNKPITNNE
jgi:hypothetical protein